MTELCLWVDVDGTIANGDHRQHHYDNRDWQEFFDEAVNDLFHHDVIGIIDTLSYYYPIVICTGRPEHMREATKIWLAKTPLVYEKLYMRPDKDFRQDDIVKIELLEQMRKDGYEPLIAFEDRDRVVKALRDVGVRVFQVKEGTY